MTQKKLAETIGTSERTLRRMSPQRRKQWQSLAAKGRSIAWFDVLAQLMFEVEAFNAVKSPNERLVIELCPSLMSLCHYDLEFVQLKSFWACDTDQLTEALQYVQGLNK